MGRAQPIPYVFTPQTHPPAKPAPPAPAKPHLVAEALESEGFAGDLLLKDLRTGPETETEVLRRWAAKEPDEVDDIGVTLCSRNRYPACVAVFDAMLPELSVDDNERMASALAHRGTALMFMGEHERAEADLLRLINEYLDGDLPARVTPSHVLNNLAWTLFLKGEFERGIPYARRAIEDDLDNGYLFNTLACLLWKAGDEDGAFEALEQSFRLGVRCDEDTPEDLRTHPRALELSAKYCS